MANVSSVLPSIFVFLVVMYAYILYFFYMNTYIPSPLYLCVLTCSLSPVRNSSQYFYFRLVVFPPPAHICIRMCLKTYCLSGNQEQGCEGRSNGLLGGLGAIPLKRLQAGHLTAGTRESWFKNKKEEFRFLVMNSSS